MKKIWRAVHLDFNLIQYYKKSICFMVCIPFVFVMVYRSLVMGISFAMFLMAMSPIYTFSVSDKIDMYRLYGMLPVTRAELVMGKYLHVILMGILTLFISCLVQPVILRLAGITPCFGEIVTAALAGMVLFLTYIAFQIPGYYKFGPIRGRIFMYVPVAGILLTMFVLEKADIKGLSIPAFLEENRFAGPCLLLIYIIIVMFVSVNISIGILKKKEWQVKADMGAVIVLFILFAAIPRRLRYQQYYEEKMKKSMPNVRKKGDREYGRSFIPYPKGEGVW